jgi:hypothetical protein
VCHSWVATVDVKIFLHTLDRTLPRTLVLTATLARIRLNDPLNRSLLPERSRYGIVLPVFRSDSTPFPGPVAILARTVYHSYPQILRTSLFSGPSGFGVGAPHILWSHKHEESCKQFG